MKKRRGRLLILMVLLMLACGGAAGFGVLTVALNLFQSAGPSDAPNVTFIIREGESTSQIANALQAQGLIHSTFAFELWARYQGLDSHLEPGSYQLSASMTIPEIVDTLLTESPEAIWLTIPAGYRVIQMAPVFAAQQDLVDFNATQFIQIAQTGSYTNNGKAVSLAAQYWFLNYDPQSAQGGAPNSIQCSAACDGLLEGYLFPNTYLVPLNATASDVIQQMLDAFGEQLCPGPASQPDMYLASEQQCQAHAAIFDQATHQTIFDLLQKAYGAASNRQSMADALRRALTIGSLVERQARTHADRQGIASVYYKRYRVSAGELTAPENGLSFLQAAPALQYWLGTSATPWPTLPQSGSQYPANPYNTYQVAGLPPSPICSPSLDALAQALNPANTPYFYFITGSDGKIHYASTSQQQQQNIQQFGQS